MKLLNYTIIFTVALLLCIPTILFGNSNDSIIKTNYEEAFLQINNMQSKLNQFSFEDAIFIMENAYYDNKLSKTEFTNTLDFHTKRILQLAEANSQHTTHNSQLLYNWAIYTYITDTTWWKLGNKYVPNYPMVYNKNDPYGTNNWESNFVTSLLDTAKKTGNCFSLSALYYIFSQRLHSEAYLVSAPQHLFIQHKGFDGNYYNIELTTRSFPGSGTIKTYTYTTHDAVTNGISMRRLNEKEAISLCLVYLAKGLEKKLKSMNYELRMEGEVFMMQCANKALEYDSLCLSAMLLKIQVLEEKLRIKNEELRIEGISKNYQSLERTLFNLYELGYRQMPQEIQSTLPTNAQGMPPFSLGEKGMGDEGFLSYYTLSNNQYPEIFTNNNKYIIGNVCLNTETNILEYLNPNQLANATTFDPVIFALSIDPLAAQFPSKSPYDFCSNNPINRIDFTGMADEPAETFSEEISRLNTDADEAESGEHGPFVANVLQIAKTVHITGGSAEFLVTSADYVTRTRLPIDTWADPTSVPTSPPTGNGIILQNGVVRQTQNILYKTAPVLTSLAYAMLLYEAAEYGEELVNPEISREEKSLNGLFLGSTTLATLIPTPASPFIITLSAANKYVYSKKYSPLTSEDFINISNEGEEGGGFGWEPKCRAIGGNPTYWNGCELEGFTAYPDDVTGPMIGKWDE